MLIPRTIGLLTVGLTAVTPPSATRVTKHVTAEARPATATTSPAKSISSQDEMPSEAHVEHSDPPSQSIGVPHRGRMIHARRLEPSEFLRFKNTTPPRQRFATDEMAALLEAAARHVDGKAPGATLTVGDLSHRRGGHMRPHRSHRNGRDVDLVFYMLDEDGHSAKPIRFVRFRADGEARFRWQSVRFDDERNWELVRYLLDNPIAEVQLILVARHLRARLLAEARRRGEPKGLVERAESVMRDRGGRHDDHFHVRIACADDDRRCRDILVRRLR